MELLLTGLVSLRFGMDRGRCHVTRCCPKRTRRACPWGDMDSFGN